VAKQLPNWAQRLELFDRFFAGLKRAEDAGDGALAGHPYRAFLLRFYETAFLMAPHWVGAVLAEQDGSVSEHVLSDRRADFQAALADITRGMDDLFQRVVALMHLEPEANPETIMDALSAIQTAALEIVTCFESLDFVTSGVGYKLPGKWWKPRWLRESDEDLLSPEALAGPFYQQKFVRIAALTASLRTALDRILAEEAGEAVVEQGHAARVRRYRERKRRKVAAVVPIEVYEDDIELLERFGYLVQDEANQQDALNGALQSFMLYGFLVHQEEEPHPWRDRVKKQRRRVRALSDRRSLQDQQ
jgi:hypothetical protein